MGVMSVGLLVYSWVGMTVECWVPKKVERKVRRKDAKKGSMLAEYLVKLLATCSVAWKVVWWAYEKELRKAEERVDETVLSRVV